MFALAVAVFLSTTTFPGAMLGFLFGVAIAFFVAGPSFLSAGALQRAGIPATDKTVAVMLIGLYVFLVASAMLATWRAWQRGAADEARRKGFGTAMLLALPMMAWLSGQALVRAWR